MWKLIPKLSFYPSLAWNVAVEKFTSREWYNRVDNTVLIGALPFRSMTSQLVDKEGVRAVVSLNEEYELKDFVNTYEEWKSVGVEQLKLPTVDLIASPSQHYLKLGIDFILKHREKNHSVYVHCKAGRTRSSTLVVCYLMTVNNWTPDKAISKLVEIRPHVWIREKQLESIKCFYKENISDRYV